jgi:hypothetical protein
MVSESSFLEPDSLSPIYLHFRDLAVMTAQIETSEP